MASSRVKTKFSVDEDKYQKVIKCARSQKHDFFSEFALTTAHYDSDNVDIVVRTCTPLSGTNHYVDQNMLLFREKNRNGYVDADSVVQHVALDVRATREDAERLFGKPKYQVTKGRNMFSAENAVICVDRVQTLGYYVVIKIRYHPSSADQKQDAEERLRTLVHALGLDSCERVEYEPGVPIPYKDIVDNVCTC